MSADAALIERSLALRVARIGAITACIGLMYSPPVSNVAMLVTFLACLCLPDLRLRLRQACQHPAGALAMIFWALVLLWCLVGEPRPWPHRLGDFWSWRKLPWFFIMLMLFDDDTWKDKLSVWFVLGALPGLLLSSVAVLNWFNLPIEADKLLRNTGTQGVSFAVAAAICFWWLLRPEQSAQRRGLWALGLLAFAVNVFVISVARSAYLGIVTLLLVVGAFQLSRRHWLALALGVALLVPAVFLTSERMQARVMTGVGEWQAAEGAAQESSLGWRYIFYKHSIAVIQSHGLLGVGTGGFRGAYAAQVKTLNYPPNDWRARPTDDPHNQFMFVWIDFGLLGLLLFIAWIGVVALQRRSAPRYRALAAALAITWSAASMFNSHFRTFAEGHLFATIAGAMVAARARRADPPAQLPNEPAARA